MNDKEFNFEDKHNYKFKVRRTEYFFIYDKEIEMYAFVKKSAQKVDTAYILEKDLNLAYRLCTKGLKNLPEIEDITGQKAPIASSDAK